MTMVTPDWAVMMARYNAWQNTGLVEQVRLLDEGTLAEDRGVFFGSLLGTLNHLLWADLVWLARFEGTPPSEVSVRDAVRFTPSGPAWATRREEVDAQILDWAQGLERIDGALRWYSGALGRETGRPMEMLVTHFFNHQTHHRGQIHAMLTGLGVRPNDTDLFIMPGAEEATA